jgi:hypothetical protein
MSINEEADYNASSKKIDMLKVLYWCEKSNDSVTTGVIANCWRKSTIISISDEFQHRYVKKKKNMKRVKRKHFCF